MTLEIFLNLFYFLIEPDAVCIILELRGRRGIGKSAEHSGRVSGRKE